MTGLSPIDKLDRRLDIAASRGGALLGFLPVGFPNLEESIQAAITVAHAGFDVIELGLPYSDPTMDGPVIQAATGHAIANGFHTEQLFYAVERITAETDVPVVVMAYWNLVLRHGVEKFAARLAAAGGAGVITPDLIPDEGADWIQTSQELGLARIFLAAPSSTDARLELITSHSTGFVYAVSTMGTTGARHEVDSAARELVDRLYKAGAKRACVGLGISEPQHVAEVLGYADGAIIGSALVKALDEEGLAGLERKAKLLASGRPSAA